MQPPALRLSFSQLLAIVLAQVLALMTQAWLSRVLLARGHEQLQAHYLAYLAVPAVLLFLLAPVLLKHRHFLWRLFGLCGLNLRLALAAVALGLAMRVAWWAQLIACVSLGITVNDDPQAIVGPVLSWVCPPAPALFLGAMVMAVLIPLMEETIHRGLLQSAFMHAGPLRAILVSAVVFTVFHPPSSYWLVFLMGIVLGIQFWLTGTLWTSMITHAVYNGLVQLDWRCLRGQWNPPPESLPQLIPGAIALATLVIVLVLVVAILLYQRSGAQDAPATAAIKARSRHAR
jgi:membrane protease YdiL (CAAX protease family)